jgi:prepilin-type N-terminal cleavage/methylation domain-containing protein
MRRTFAGPRAAGFTLIELLVVISILAVLTGLAVGGFANMGRGTALGSAEQMVRASLQRVRQEATEIQAPTFLELRPTADGPLELVQGRTQLALTWHFEGELTAKGTLSGRNTYSPVLGGRRIEDGRLGDAVRLMGGTIEPERGRQERDPWLDPSEGFRLRGYVRLDDAPRRAKLASYGGAFLWEITDEGGLAASLRLMDPKDEEREVQAETGGGLLLPGRWCEVEVSFDGWKLDLRVHSVLEAREEARGRLLLGEKDRFVFGGNGLSADVDEIRYETVAWDEAVEMPLDVELEHQGVLTVRFGPQGRLDPTVHAGPQVIRLRLGVETEAITIEPSGVVR